MQNIRGIHCRVHSVRNNTVNCGDKDTNFTQKSNKQTHDDVAQASESMDDDKQDTLRTTTDTQLTNANTYDLLIPPTQNTSW